MSKHTPGPWQVITQEHPHYLGGVHIERRIFTSWDHPQLKGPMGVVNSSVGVGETKEGQARHMVSIEEADARLIAAAPELLEALKGLDEAYCRAGASLTREERTEDRKRLIAARAAIAKATGEKQ